MEVNRHIDIGDMALGNWLDILRNLLWKVFTVCIKRSGRWPLCNLGKQLHLPCICI